MGVTTEVAPNPEPPASQDVARKHIRGSSLLVAGRFISGGLNFASQVLLARYLSTTDYGYWAYALSVVTLCQTLSSHGLDKALARFIPHYHENGQYPKLFGTIFFVFGSIITVGFLIITILYAFPEQILGFLTKGKDEPLVLLSIMVFLVPLQALDDLFTGLFASFASPRAIFFRKHLLGPVLKLVAIVVLVWMGSGVTTLAYGYLTATILGIAIYSWILMGLLRRRGLFEPFALSGIKIPALEILAFTLPLLTTDCVKVLINSANAIILGYFRDMREVAVFRVVEPAVAWNMIVMRSFSLLYLPALARIYARNDRQGVSDLYWKTAVWMAVLTFPIFALTFSMSHSLTIFVYGPRYQESGTILALLALGKYFNVALGFNALTLQVVGRMRSVILINLFAAMIDIGLSLYLIPRYGALGAAVSSAATLIIYNLLLQAGLQSSSGISFFDARYTSVYLMIGLCSSALFIFDVLTPDYVYTSLAFAVVVSFVVVLVSKNILKVGETFPEILRVPLVRKLFA